MLRHTFLCVSFRQLTSQAVNICRQAVKPPTWAPRLHEKSDRDYRWHHGMVLSGYAVWIFMGSIWKYQAFQALNSIRSRWMMLMCLMILMVLVHVHGTSTKNLRMSRRWPISVVQSPRYGKPVCAAVRCHWTLEARWRKLIDIIYNYIYMGVSKNRGTPKWMVYNGKPY